MLASSDVERDRISDRSHFVRDAAGGVYGHDPFPGVSPALTEASIGIRII
jgi:hypothetical protein